MSPDAIRRRFMRNNVWRFEFDAPTTERDITHLLRVNEALAKAASELEIVKSKDLKVVKLSSTGNGNKHNQKRNSRRFSSNS